MPSPQLIRPLERAISGSIGLPHRVGLDLVHIPRIAQSLQAFGERFQRKLFTDHEIAYAASAPAHRDERFAARFAAKEATIKALQLGNAGVSWREMEVWREATGECTLRLHGRAAEIAAQAGLHPELTVCLSHDGDYAAAVVVARPRLTQQ
jgi:holo-[acyl-carrier protein] synthase